MRNRNRGGDAPPLGILAMTALVSMLDRAPDPGKPQDDAQPDRKSPPEVEPEAPPMERIARVALESADGDNAVACILEICSRELGADRINALRDEGSSKEDPVINRPEFLHVLHLDLHDFHNLDESQDKKRFSQWMSEFAEFITLDGPPVSG